MEIWCCMTNWINHYGHCDGKLNGDLDKANQLNQVIYGRGGIQLGGNLHDYRFITSRV